VIPLKDENPASSAPIVTTALVAINVLAFIYEAGLPPAKLEALVLQMGLTPAEVTGAIPYHAGPPIWMTVVTSMFLHGGLLHLAGNMLYLWIFGNNVEDAAGHLGFLAFYLLSGLAAAGAQVAAAPSSRVPMIGASGAIAGVLGAYMVLFPHARILTLIPIFIFIRIVRLPAVFVLGLWFVYQILLSGASGAAGGGVAFFAHIGGFVTGMILIWIFRRRR
jgi:rhomboid family protein